MVLMRNYLYHFVKAFVLNPGNFHKNNDIKDALDNT